MVYGGFVMGRVFCDVIVVKYVEEGGWWIRVMVIFWLVVKVGMVGRVKGRVKKWL